jgi:hypothetical protein
MNDGGDDPKVSVLIDRRDFFASRQRDNAYARDLAEAPALMAAQVRLLEHQAGCIEISGTSVWDQRVDISAIGTFDLEGEGEI